MVAICLDLVDFIFGNIPILNTIWDITTYGVLFLILKDKRLASFTNLELLLPGLPMLGQIDALLPIATIVTLIDISKETNDQNKNRIWMNK